MMWMDTVQNPTPPAPDRDADIKENKDIAALGYVWVLSVFAFFYRPHSPFTRFHARQGMVLFGMSLIFWMIPMVGRFLELIVLVLAIMGFLAAAQGQYKELSLVYAISHGDMKGLRRSWQGIVEWIVGLWHKVRKPKTDSVPPVPPVASQPPQASTPAPPENYDV